MTREDIKKLLLENADMLKKYKVNKLGIFGSYATGKARKRSDVDLLVDFEENIDLFEFVHLVDDIQAILKTKVDLATPDAIKPYIRSKVMGEVEWIEGI
jgi:predicted nucleotidyltransferase